MSGVFFIRQFILLFCTLSLNKSSKEILKVHFVKAPPEKIYLYSFYGIEISKFDSASSDKSGIFKFYNNENLKKGFYRLSVNDSNYVDLILTGEEKVSITFKENLLKSDVEIKESIENKALWELKKHRLAFNKQRKELLTHLKLLEGNSTQSVNTQHSIDSLERSFNVFALKLLNKHKNTYFYLTNKIILSPLYTHSSLLSNFYNNDTGKFLKENYFNNIDFSREELVNSTLLPNQYMKYFEKHVNYDEKGFKDAIDIILLKSKANPAVYQLSLDFLLKLFDETGPDIIFEYLVNNYYNHNTCSKTYTKKAGALKSLTVGNQLPDISINDSLFNNLKEIYSNNKITLIYFWSSHCNFCTSSFPLLLKTYNDYHVKGFEIVSFSLDEDKQTWQIFSFENQIKWFNFNEPTGWDSKTARALLINKTPTYYLIDSNGIILEKNHNFESIVKTIKSIL